MLKAGFALAAATFLVSPYGPFPLTKNDDPNGRWEGQLTDANCAERGSSEGLCLELTLKQGNRLHKSTWEFPVSVDQLKGLSARSAEFTRPDVHFELKRDAGTLSFEGGFDRGFGTGEFVFLGDRDYRVALDRLGYDRPSEIQLLSLAIHDISQRFLGDLKLKGYGHDLDEVTTFAIHGVTPAFIGEIEELGYDHPSSDQLVALRIHGVTADYVRDLQRDGKHRPSLDDLVSMKIHGVDGEMTHDLADAGVDDFDDDDLTTLKIHGVDLNLAKALWRLGEQVDVDDLVSLSVQGVTPEYIEQMVDAGLEGLDTDGLVSLKVQGIDPNFVREMVRLGLKSLDVNDLVSARVQGLDPEFVREMVKAGFDHLDLDDLIELKIQGVSAKFAREFREDDPDGNASDLLDAWQRGGRHSRSGRHRGI